MSTIDIKVSLSNEQKGLKALLQKKREGQRLKNQDLSQFWSESSYGLEKSEVFNSFSDDQKRECLESLSRSRLEEAFHIEKSGMAYTAKMTLLSNSFEERQLYSHFSEDEARHLSYLTRALDNVSDDYKNNPFLNLLEQIIQDGQRRPLIFIIQILLEGWGIEHYFNMAKDCQNKEFAPLLQQIVKDEASHHGSGLILFDERELTLNEKNYIQDVLVEFFHMIQLGPVSTLQALEKVNGGLTKAQKVVAYEQLNAFEQTQSKIETLKKLMHKSDSNNIMSEMESRGLLTAYSNQKAIDQLSCSSI